MSNPVTSIRLLAIAKKYNIGKNTLVKFINSEGFEIEESESNMKLTEEMLELIEVEFENKEIKGNENFNQNISDLNITTTISAAANEINISIQTLKSFLESKRFKKEFIQNDEFLTRGMIIALRKENDTNKFKFKPKTITLNPPEFNLQEYVEINFIIAQYLKIETVNKPNKRGIIETFYKSRLIKNEKIKNEENEFELLFHRQFYRKEKLKDVNPSELLEELICITVRNASHYKRTDYINQNRSQIIENDIIQISKEAFLFDNNSILSLFKLEKPITFKVNLNNQTLNMKEVNYNDNSNSKGWLENYHNKAVKLFIKEFGHYFDSSYQDNIDDFIYIPWQDVIFYNGFIQIKIKNKRIEITIATSNEVLNELTTILSKKSEDGLIFSKNDKNNYILQNEEVLQNVVLFLKIQYKLNNLEMGDPAFKSLISEFKNVFNTARHSLPKSYYFNYLFENHDIEYPVVPVSEINQSIEEPSYIFTLVKNNNIYLIWENKNEGRATYIFHSEVPTYSKTLQILHDYIKADLKRKRSNINQYTNQLIELSNSIKFIGKISHSDLGTWKDNLKNLMKK